MLGAFSKFLGCQFKATQAVKECKSYRTAKHKHKEIEDEFACVDAMQPMRGISCVCRICKGVVKKIHNLFILIEELSEGVEDFLRFLVQIQVQVNDQCPIQLIFVQVRRIHFQG